MRLRGVNKAKLPSSNRRRTELHTQSGDNAYSSDTDVPLIASFGREVSETRSSSSLSDDIEEDATSDVKTTEKNEVEKQDKKEKHADAGAVGELDAGDDNCVEDDGDSAESEDGEESSAADDDASQSNYAHESESEDETQDEDESEDEDELQSDESDVDAQSCGQNDVNISEDLKREFAVQFKGKSTLEESRKWKETHLDFVCEPCKRQGKKCEASKASSACCSNCAKVRRTCSRVEAERKSRITKRLNINSLQYAALLKHYKDQRPKSGANNVKLGHNEDEQGGDRGRQRVMHDQNEIRGDGVVKRHKEGCGRITEDLKKEFHAAFWARGMKEERREWVEANKNLTCDRCNEGGLQCEPNMFSSLNGRREILSVKCKSCAIRKKQCSLLEVERKHRLMKLFDLDASEYDTLKDHAMSRYRNSRGIGRNSCPDENEPGITKGTQHTMDKLEKVEPKKLLKNQGRSGGGVVLQEDTNLNKQKYRQVQRERDDTGIRESEGTTTFTKHLNDIFARAVEDCQYDLQYPSGPEHTELQEANQNSTVPSQFSNTLPMHSWPFGQSSEHFFHAISQPEHSSPSVPPNPEFDSSRFTFSSVSAQRPIQDTSSYRYHKSESRNSASRPGQNVQMFQGEDFRNQEDISASHSHVLQSDTPSFQGASQGLSEGANRVQQQHSVAKEVVKLHLLKRKFDDYAEHRAAAHDWDGAALFFEASKSIGDIQTAPLHSSSNTIRGHLTPVQSTKRTRNSEYVSPVYWDGGSRSTRI